MTEAWTFTGASECAVPLEERTEFLSAAVRCGTITTPVAEDTMMRKGDIMHTIILLEKRPAVEQRLVELGFERSGEPGRAGPVPPDSSVD